MGRTRVTVRDNTSLINELRNLASAKATAVHVGVPKGATSEHGGMKIAQYAWINEFGEEGHPERSFMRSTFDDHYDEWDTNFRRWLGKRPTQQRLERALTMIGRLAQQHIKAKIKSNVPPPNNADYLEWKRFNRKHGGYIGTLFLTGSMHNSIQYSLVDRYGEAVN